MSFPVTPQPDDLDERGLFLVQDPALRLRILPLFSFDPEDAKERPRGHGTAFRIDPWAHCVTAYHVMEDLFVLEPQGKQLALRPNLRLAALELGGITYGRLRLPPDAWRPLSGSFTIFSIENELFRQPRMRNVAELVTLRIEPSSRDESGTPYLPLDLRRWYPSIGERVLALGFADLDISDGGDDRPIEQYLYGAIGEITDIEPADGARGRPWPVIRVAAEWPRGMSGGPVLNETGHVIGIVSSGIGGRNIGSATFFSGWDMPERIFRSVDPNNPGWFLCYGVFDNTGSPIFVDLDKAKVERFAREGGLTELGPISIDLRNGDHMRR